MPEQLIEPERPVIGERLSLEEWRVLFTIQDPVAEARWRAQSVEQARVELARRARLDAALGGRSPLLEALQRQREQGGWRPPGE